MQQNEVLRRVPCPLKAGIELQYEVEQFLYREAALLDNRKFEQWLDILGDDIRYFMPLRTNRARRELDREYSNDGESAYFDDDKETMKSRVRKLRAPGCWAEDPPSRTRHIVSNVVIEELRENETILVSSAFIIYRGRLERHVDILSGERRDVIRRSSNVQGFEIAERTILIDQATFLAYSLSFFL